MKSKFNFRILTIIAGIALLDLMIKVLVLNALGFQNEFELIPGVVSIIPIANVRGTSEGFTLMVAVQILFVGMFIRMQSLNIANGFKWSSAMILSGWIGNLIDHFVFAEKYGREGYGDMDYLFDALFTGSVTSITTIMILAGWMWLVIAMVTKLNDTKKIFSK